MVKTEKTVILAFSFGAPKNIRPNRLIAHRATYLSLSGNTDIFTQKDIPLDQMNPIFAENVSAKKDYFSTLDVVQSFVNWIIISSIRGEKEIWKECIMVAAPQHQWRCCRDLKKTLKEHGLTMEIFVDDGLEFEDMYDKYSHQSWTRSKWKWWLREIPLRLLPWWLYKKMCKQKEVKKNG